MTPFILLGRKKLPPESPPSDEQVYDEYQQLWVNKNSGLPVIISLRTQLQSSFLGETTLTETREGADQTELANVLGSPFGETTVSKTMEGVDQMEIFDLSASQFGETTMSTTAEGADQSERTVLPPSQLARPRMQLR
jgi:hypothetical protein